MNNQEVGALIRSLRLEKTMTQKQIAKELNITEQAVSKWERGLGLPDISSLGKLSECLGVNLSDLLEGKLNENDKGEGKLKNIHFYVCPVCENLVFSTSETSISCCGRKVASQEPRLAEEGERMKVEQVEDDWYITSNHPMSKDNYISFTAFVCYGKAEIFSHYPEWNYELRIPRFSKGTLFWYSQRDGLRRQEIWNNIHVEF